MEAAGGDRGGGRGRGKPLRRNRIPVRKRLKHVKRHASGPEQSTVYSDAGPSPSVAVTADNTADEINSEVELSSDYSLSDHDYSRPSSSLSRPGSSLSLSLSVSIPDLTEDSSLSDTSSGLFSPTLGPSGTPASSPAPPATLKDAMCEPSSPIWPLAEPQSSMLPPPPPPLPEDVNKLWLEVRNKLFLMLPANFVPVVDKSSLHVLMVGRRESKSVQRALIFSQSGSVKIEVHTRDYPAHSLLRGVLDQKPPSEENVGYFVDRIIQILSNLRALEICAGMDKQEFKEVWSITPNGSIVNDVFKECRYQETFRSKNCTLLVDSKKWRCRECSHLQPFLKRKMEALKQDTPCLNTNTRFLLDKQKSKRLEIKQKIIKKKSLTIDRLQARMQELIARDGVKVDKGLSDDLTNILQSGNLSASHSLFLQQQIKAVKSKRSSAMRWHPTLIRLALSIYLKSPSAYKDLRESGFIKLPCARTLFDYSHATEIEQGIDSAVIETLSAQVQGLEKSVTQYHVLMADEIHVSKNLVVQKSTGDLIGFTNMDHLDSEIKTMDSFLEDPEKVVEHEMATKIMAFMVKGVSSRVKDVVASYPVCNASPRQMYLWTWDVIGALEKNGLKVIAFTCDGAATNRAFIKLHKPVSETASGVIFDTVNKYAPRRNIHFFSDVPHLLKTIRNALFNSRLKKKGTRCLKKNGEAMVWDTIIKLYLSEKEKTIRKAHKLTAQAVFPDSYSRMKVRLAAIVLSKTVANDIRGKQWPRTTELVDFITKTNDWFDLLNGAFASHGKKTNNRRLDPYTKKDVEDFQNQAENSRFEELLSYVDYLEEWRRDVATRRQHAADMSAFSELGVDVLDGDVSFHALNESNHEDDFQDESKCLLPHQSQVGVEMSSRAFIGAVTFLLKDGVSFVNARVFCQDPLEQNFGKQRMRGGGSTNPNVAQYYRNQRAITNIGQLAAAKRSAGNTEIIQEDGGDDLSTPLAKRKYERK